YGRDGREPLAVGDRRAWAPRRKEGAPQALEEHGQPRPSAHGDDPWRAAAGEREGDRPPLPRRDCGSPRDHRRRSRALLTAGVGLLVPLLEPAREGEDRVAGGIADDDPGGVVG